MMFGIHRHLRVPRVRLEKLQIETGKHGGYCHVQLCVRQTFYLGLAWGSGAGEGEKHCQGVGIHGLTYFSPEH